jgi:hypothetical protein
MPVNVKIEYVDGVAVIDQGVRAEEKQGSLLVYGEDSSVVARFSVSKVEHWWIGSAKKPDSF